MKAKVPTEIFTYSNDVSKITLPDKPNKAVNLVLTNPILNQITSKNQLLIEKKIETKSVHPRFGGDD